MNRDDLITQWSKELEAEEKAHREKEENFECNLTIQKEELLKDYKTLCAYRSSRKADIEKKIRLFILEELKKNRHISIDLDKVIEDVKRSYDLYIKSHLVKDKDGNMYFFE